MVAIRNFTGAGEGQTLLAELFCSAELAGGIQSQLIFLSVLNIFLSITAFLGNTLILVALYKETSLHPPSKLLLRSLAATDLCVGIIVEPFYVIYLMSVVNKQWNICRFSIVTVFITGEILCLVSLLTLTAISVDRLLALLLGLRYRQVVTLKRTYVTVIVFWAVSIVGCIPYLWNESLIIICSYSYIILTLCILISIYSYTRIFLRLRHHQTQFLHNVTGQPNQTTPQNIARYRKTASSTLWLQLTLVVCFLPYIVVLPFTLRETRGKVSYGFLHLAFRFALNLVYFNSSLNPLLYCWKISEVKQAVKDTVRRLFCS